MAAENAEIQIFRYWCVEAKCSLEYALYTPPGVTEEEGVKVPRALIVLLHDKGSRPAEALSYPGILSIAKDFNSSGCLVVAPLGFDEHGWYGCCGDSAPQHSGLLSESDVINVVGIVRKEYTVDDQRIYLMGLGIGGSGVLHLASKYSFLWAGAFAASADVLAIQNVEPLEEVIKTMKVPVMLVHGANDPVVSSTSVRRWVEQMNRTDMTYKYLELEGINKVHESGWDGLAKEAFGFFAKHNRSKGAPRIVRPSVFYEKSQKRASTQPQRMKKKKNLTTQELKLNSDIGVPYERTSTSTAEPEPESATCWV